MRQLSALDAQFLAMEDDALTGHVSGLAILDPSTRPGGTLTLADLAEALRERLHLLPPLRWRLAEVPMGLDLPYWYDDPEFDLDFHLREIALPPPGGDAQLAEQTARIVSRALDRTRPLWELYLIHGLSRGRVAVLTKIHHAMVDGMSGAEIMGVLFDLAPEGRELEPPGDGALDGEPKPTGAQMLARGLAGLPRQPVRIAQSLPHTIPALDVVPSIFGLPGASSISRTFSRLRGARRDDGEVVERPAMRAPRTPFSGRVSQHRRFAFSSLSLDEVKAVKNAFGVKVNDVVVALCAGAVRDWLLEHDALPDRPLLAMIPVSVRGEDQMGTFGNRVSVMIVPIPTDEADPVDRLRAANRHLRDAKERHKALPAQALQDVTNFIPPAINARAARVVTQLGAAPGMRPLFNLVISNVPGPPIPLYMAGAKLEHNFPVSVIAHGSGLNVTVMSYLDRVDFGIVCDRDQMPDVERLSDALGEDLGALVAAADAQTAVTSTSTP